MGLIIQASCGRVFVASGQTALRSVKSPGQEDQMDSQQSQVGPPVVQHLSKPPVGPTSVSIVLQAPRTASSGLLRHKQISRGVSQFFLFIRSSPSLYVNNHPYRLCLARLARRPGLASNFWNRQDSFISTQHSQYSPIYS
jgi:hypothetical protein